MRLPAIFVVVLGFSTAVGQTAVSKGSLGSFVEVRQGKIYYEECGSGPDAVILMHDGVAHSAVFDDVWPMFCNRFHTIRYDRRGYGRSHEATSPYYEADDLAALIINRKLNRVALVASSHGGQVAMEYAMRYSRFVAELVVIGPGVTGFPYSEHFLTREYTIEQKKGEALRESMVQDPYLILATHAAARKRLREILTAAPQDYTHNDMPLPEHPIFPSVQQLRMPTLILIGSGDIADNQAVAGALVVSIPGAQRIVMPDAGHLMYMEHPEQFFGEVNRFLTLHGFGGPSGR
ncbi:MAG TPA: alpha/beta hydrolase [Terriglobales bacterium]|nr:alpha/beta hydrolase [Terriglobales bacterium]